MPNSHHNFKSLLKTVTHKYFYYLNPSNDHHAIFTKSDFTTLNNLSGDKSICVTKPDKGCGVLILNWTHYEQKVYNITNDPDQFK